MKSAEEIQENLGMFTGTEHYYKHLGIMITDGVKYLAESAGAYWFVDLISSYQFSPEVKDEKFQVYKLEVKADKSAIVEISDGNFNILITQEIEYTDFPLVEIKLYCIDKICLLPSEY
jgi:hypothetical protein